MARQTKENAYAYSYHVNYIRNSRAIGIAWGIFTLCFAILLVILLLEPFWLQSQTGTLGSFGLFSSQRSSHSLISGPEAQGTEYHNLIGNSGPLKTRQKLASWFVIAALVLIGASIFMMFLFLCKTPSTSTVFTMAGICQIIAGVCLFLGVVIYPSSFKENEDIQNCCPGSNIYEPGDDCFYSWAFFLAIVGIFNALALGILALILARKQEKLETEVTYSDYSRPNGKGYGTTNSYGSSIGKASSIRNGGAGSVGRRSAYSDADRGEDAARSLNDAPYASVTPRSQRVPQNNRGIEGDDEASVASRNSTMRNAQKPHDVVT